MQTRLVIILNMTEQPITILVEVFVFLKRDRICPIQDIAPSRVQAAELSTKAAPDDSLAGWIAVCLSFGLALAGDALASFQARGFFADYGSDFLSAAISHECKAFARP